MFHTISKHILEQMKALEEIDSKDRKDGTSITKRLRQVPPETGKFLALMAASAPTFGDWLEIGTSAGYSALWISLAARQRGTRLTTYELLPDKAALAKKTFKQAKVGDSIELVNGDARGHVSQYDEIGFCFLDAEKEMYQEFYELIAPRLVPGGLLLVDNAINHAEALEDFLEYVAQDESVDSLIVPIGKGVLLCRKQGSLMDDAPKGSSED